MWKILVALAASGAASLQASPWTESVEKEIASWKTSTSAPLVPIYRQAFLGDLPHQITVRLNEGEAAPPKTREVYIGDGIVSVRGPAGEWNVFADGTQAYAWKEGESSGLVEKENVGQILSYLLGVFSPAELISGSYCAYLDRPKEFRIKETDGTVEFSPVGRDFSPFTFVLQKKPLWLSGFRVTSPVDGKKAEMKVSFPEHVAEIPAPFTRPPGGVEFQEGAIPWQRELIPYF